MSKSNKSCSEAQTPDLKTIFAKVRELASHSAAGLATQPSKAPAISKRSRDDEAAASADSEQLAAAESSAEKRTQSRANSAVTITFGDCAENHVGAIALQAKTSKTLPPSSPIPSNA
jgi:hypothetical protein